MKPLVEASSSSPPVRRVSASLGAARPVVLDYWELAKPEISFLVTISALAGFVLGSGMALDVPRLCFALAGTALCAAASGVLNHVAEQKLDALMRRTADRPLPAGRITTRAASLYAFTLLVLGLGALAFTNLLTVGLAALTVALYLFVYTPLKRRTPHNTLVGTIPGALPALGGYTAATGTLGATGWVLFAILACWQIPHFLALAWMYRKDYARADYRMLPVTSPNGRATAQQTLYFTVALAIISAVPVLLGSAGWLYLAGAIGLALWFLMPVCAFYRTRSTKDARRVLKASIAYIPLLVAFICIDHWL